MPTPVSDTETYTFPFMRLLEMVMVPESVYFTAFPMILFRTSHNFDSSAFTHRGVFGEIVLKIEDFVLSEVVEYFDYGIYLNVQVDGL